MKNFKVLIPQPIAEEGINYLQNNGCEIVTPDGVDCTTLKEAVKDCDAILVRTAKINRDVIESANNLKVIARHGVGLDNVDIEAATENDIYVCNAPTANSNSVAEHVVGMMLTISHHIVRADKELRQGNFEMRNYLIGSELAGKTIGLIGFGNIGKLVAKKCGLGMGMKVLVFDPYIDQIDKGYVDKANTINELFLQADYISLHIPYSRKLHHFIGKEKLSLMKPTAYLINAARGGLVDEEALYQLLVSKRISGAAIDCFEVEPTPSKHPLWQLENVVVTPHMAAHSKEAMVRMALEPAKEIVRVKDGEEPVVCVNRKSVKPV
jgi:D-3-phosphoglycerate dehydrogenase